MTEKRFEDRGLIISNGYIQDNYYDEKISNPTQLIKELNSLHEENVETDKENHQLHNEINELCKLGDKQANFIQMKGYTFKELFKFIKQEKRLKIPKFNNNKRFLNRGRLIIDNETTLHYIMSLVWEVGLIVKLLNNFHEENEQLKKEVDEQDRRKWACLKTAHLLDLENEELKQKLRLYKKLYPAGKWITELTTEELEKELSR